MGFLMGAYGKLMAGQRMRSIQFQLTTVQSRLRRITREIGDKEKMYQAQERNMKNQMQAQTQYFIMGGLQQLAGSNPVAAAYLNAMSGAGYGEMSGISSEQQYQFSSAYSMIQQQAQMQASMANNMWQQVFEMQRDADLNALKDVEESLQLEKDNLETQLKIASADYEANKDMEKQGAQNLKPDYTGQA
jgi:hypothetical protein